MRNKCFSLIEHPAERVDLILATPIKRFADQLSPPNPSTPDLLLSNRLLEHVFYIFELAKSAHWWSKYALLAFTWCVELLKMWRPFALVFRIPCPCLFSDDLSGFSNIWRFYDDCRMSIRWVNAAITNGDQMFKPEENGFYWHA